MPRTRSTARLVLAGLGVLAALVHVSARPATAQAPETPPARVPTVTLDEALRRAEGDSPSVGAAFEEADGASAGLAAARSMSWSWNQPFGLGIQMPDTRRAQAALRQARANEQLARFNAQVEAAAAFLAVVHASD